jgi:HAD superfamily phosphatase (TIGR01668 family)
LELDLARLESLGLDALLLDADCTLKEYRSEEPLEGIDEWLATLREANIGLCLISNGLGPRIERFAKRVDLPFFAPAKKPLPFGCRRAVRTMKFDPRRTAIVGDQIFADIMAGRLAGLRSILVDPIHPEQEKWFTQIKRPFERLVISRPK